jgi:hypothetical protein
MKTLAVYLIGFASLLCSVVSFAQSTGSVQLTPVPPKPTCTPLLPHGSCADLWRNYNNAVAQRAREEIQVYVNRQKELASSQATAPLQQLIADQQAQIKKLQDQMQADSDAALQAKSDAHREGLQYGSGIGVGATLVFLGLVFGIRRLMQNFSVTKKPQSRAASA